MRCYEKLIKTDGDGEDLKQRLEIKMQSTVLIQYNPKIVFGIISVNYLHMESLTL